MAISFPIPLMMTTCKSMAQKVSAAAMLSLAGAQHAFAEFGSIPTVGGGGTDIRGTVLDILSAILNLMALAAVAVIIFAGIRLVIGGSDESQREKARNAILYAVIGLIVILLAQAIVSFVNTNVASN